MKKLFHFISLGIIFNLEIENCFAQPGSLDLTFSSDGKTTTPIGSSIDVGYSVAVQSDGKIVVAGNSNNGTNQDFALVRYNTDGSLDSTFSSDGKVTTPIGSSNDDGRSVALQTDGKIVVVGRSYNGTDNDFALVRYNSDGTLDNTFGSGGKRTTNFGFGNADAGLSVAIQMDGKIVVAGYSENSSSSDFALARYNSNGSLDFMTTTDFGGYHDIGYSVAVQSDGKIVVAGKNNNSWGSNTDIALVRYNSNGSLDNTFGTGGKVTTPSGSYFDAGRSVAIQTDGKIVVAGDMGNSFALVRYNNNGSLDTSLVTTSVGGTGRSVAIQTDSKIVVAGYGNNGSDNDFVLVRYNTDGSFDSTFSSDGKVTTPIGSSDDDGNSVAIQTDGKIVVAGTSSYDFAVVRYNVVCSPINFSQSPTICNGQNITVGSNTYTVSGTYIDTLTANGCDSIVATNLIVNPLPTATITSSGATTFCQGNSVTLTASAATSYLWSNSVTTQNITVSTSGNYYVSITDGSGCSATSTLTTVTVNPLPTATITPSGATTFCQGDSVTLTGSSANSYLWSNSATTQSITGSTSGNYSVTVTDGNSCSATSTPTTVTVNPLPTATITPSGATTFCQGDSVTLTGSSANSYLWNNSATTQSITVSTSGNYSVTVTDGNSCSATSISTTVTVNPLPTKPTITNTANGTTLTSSSSTGNQWYLNSNIIPGATSQTYTVTQNGIYTVVVTNSNGCSATSLPYNYTIIGIEELLIDNGIVIIPNPSNGRFRIETNNFNLDRIKILNTLGEAIYQSEIRNTEIDLSAQPKGIYFIEVRTNKKTYKGKIIIQ